MSLLYKRLTVGVAIVGTAILAFGVACFAAGACINTVQDECIPSRTFRTWRDDRTGGRNTATPRQTLQTG
jgi:hypothetical protein